MLNFLLKLRDKTWYMTQHYYSDSSSEDNRPYFEIRFWAIFFITCFLPICVLLFLLGPTRGGSSTDKLYVAVFILGFMAATFYANKWLLKQLDRYPINPKNDGGYRYNQLFLMSILLGQFLLFFAVMYFIQKVD